MEILTFLFANFNEIINVSKLSNRSSWLTLLGMMIMGILMN